MMTDSPPSDTPQGHRADPRHRRRPWRSGRGDAAGRQGLAGHRDRPAGHAGRARQSSITRDGHRFDLGPTIVTVPQGLRELWAACGRDFDRDVDLRPLDPFYEIRWPDGIRFTARQDTTRCGPRWPGCRPAICRATTGSWRCRAALSGSGSRIWAAARCTGFADLLKVLPTFAALRADRSVYAHAARAGEGRTAAHGPVVPSAVHRRRPVSCDLDVYPGQPSRKGVRRPLRHGRRRRDRRGRWRA